MAAFWNRSRYRKRTRTRTACACTRATSITPTPELRLEAPATAAAGRDTFAGSTDGKRGLSSHNHFAQLLAGEEKLHRFELLKHFLEAAIVEDLGGLTQSSLRQHEILLVFDAEG